MSELRPSVRPRRRWLVYAARVAALAGAVVLVARCVVGPRALDCKRASADAPPGVAVVVCRAEYAASQDLETGVRLADALEESGDATGASAIARGLLSHRAVRGDALQTLGRVAASQQRGDDAIAAFRAARALHREDGKRSDVARDAQALAGVLVGRGELAEALAELAECITEARAAGARTLEAYCRLSAGKTLGRVGYFEGAQGELDRARPAMDSDYDRATFHAEQGNLYQELARDPRRPEHHRRAIAELEQALRFATRAQATDLVLSLELNLAYSLAEVGDPDAAENHLATATVLDRSGGDDAARRILAARIAYRRGNPALATALHEQLFPILPPDDDRMEVSVLQARIALAAGDLAAAARWAQRGVDDVEHLRRKQTALELRPWVLASRREPYELLFTALARAWRAEDAIAVFDQWQGRTLLDSIARPRSAPWTDLAATAGQLRALGGWLPVVSSAPLVATDRRAVADALGGLDVLALVVADGELWRITASRGQLRLVNLGRLAALEEPLVRFRSEPTNHAIADALGARLLDDDAARLTPDVLHVVIDAQLGALPVVALRRAGRPLIAARPVVRLPRMPTLGCAPPAAGEGAAIVADAKGDLPAARLEASTLAGRGDVTGFVGAEATSAALFAARSRAVLHVAVHGGVGPGGGVLELYDRGVSALEISAARIGPPLVVLSACSSAASGDPELAGALSTAFLAAGSTYVVATMREVSVAGASELLMRFYRAGGITDPVRALATTQAALAGGDNRDWPNFAIFSQAACAAPAH